MFGSWTHVAFVRSGDELSLWINGSKDQNTATFTGTIYSGSGPLTLGRINFTGNEYYYDGLIDEVRVSSVARYTATNAVADGSSFRNDGADQFRGHHT
ncbi:MAG: LamG-like jellyroll fold domain-containing protein [Planctomycetota bacterium]